MFTCEQKIQIKQWAKKHNKNLKPVIDRVRKAWGIETSKDKYLGKINYTIYYY